MSKIEICPRCGKSNCVSDYTHLNYCMWCSYSFKAEREAKEIKKDENGQIKLF